MVDVARLGFISMITRDLEGTAQHFVDTFNGVRRQWTNFAPRDDGWTGTTVYIAGIPLQVMTPTEKGSVLDRALEKRGESIYAIRFDVPDLEATCKELEAKGLRIVGHMPEVEAFIHPKDNHGIMVELGQMR
ncbi:MAG: VOC family protein [Dehalococcoidia bacterium]